MEMAEAWAKNAKQKSQLTWLDCPKSHNFLCLSIYKTYSQLEQMILMWNTRNIVELAESQYVCFLW